TNRDNIKIIERIRGVAPQWKGADASRPMLVVAANVDQLTGAGAICLCVANAASGHFQIPGPMLANLPPTEHIPGPPLSLLLIDQSPAGAQASVQARGLDRGFGVLISGDGKSVDYR